MPDKKWGETPCAFIDLRPDAEGVTEEKIISFCRDNMAHFKAPRKVIFGPLPKTSTGKVRKFELRQRARHI
jgi:fatty-acyl-CoA synthase